MKKDKIIISVLLFLLVLAVSYIGFSKYHQWKQEKELDIFKQGTQYGYEQAIIQIVNQAVTCEEVPLRIANETLNIIATGCLAQQTGGIAE